MRLCGKVARDRLPDSVKAFKAEKCGGGLLEAAEVPEEVRSNTHDRGEAGK